LDLERLTQPLERLASNSTDADAWELLYRALWPYVIGMLFRYFQGQRRLAEEGAQEVMIRLLRYADFNAGHREPRAFLSYVHSACRSVVMDWHRREGTEPASADVAELELRTPSDTPSPEEVEISRDLIDKVSGRLSPEELSLTESLLGGKTPDEISAELQISLPAYYQRVSRLRKRVRTILASLSETA
jgi:RNA polymerase sigma factor (sigma-70 family)